MSSSPSSPWLPVIVTVIVVVCLFNVDSSCGDSDRGRRGVGISSSSQCQSSTDKWLFPDAVDCSHFVVCLFVGTLFQRAQRMVCPEGLVFNPNIDACDYSTNVDCSHYVIIQDTTTSSSRQRLEAANTTADVSAAAPAETRDALLDIRSKERVDAFLAAMLWSRVKTTTTAYMTSPSSPATWNASFAAAGTTIGLNSTLRVSSLATDVMNSTSADVPLFHTSTIASTSSSMTSAPGSAGSPSSTGASSGTPTNATGSYTTGMSGSSLLVITSSFKPFADNESFQATITSQTSSSLALDSSLNSTLSTPTSTYFSDSNHTTVRSSHFNVTSLATSPSASSTESPTIVSFSPTQSTALLPGNRTSSVNSDDKHSLTTTSPAATSTSRQAANVNHNTSKSDLTTISFTGSDVVNPADVTTEGLADYYGDYLPGISANFSQQKIAMETVVVTTHATINLTNTTSFSTGDENVTTTGKTGSGRVTAGHHMTS